MKTLYIYLLLLILPPGILSQNKIELNTPPTTGGTIVACESILLLPGFDFEAASGKSLELNIDPYSCDPFNGIPAKPSKDMNYIQTKTYLNESGNRSLDQITYFDGLGRPVETVQRGVTPNKADLVTYQEYDGTGRPSKSWLPAVAASNHGAMIKFHLFEPKAKVTYNSTSLNYLPDAKPYSIPVYDNAPGERVIQQYAPGEKWHQDYTITNGRALITLNENNDECKLYTCIRYDVGTSITNPVLSTKGNYDNYQLYVTQRQDEDKNISYEFSDKSGQTVLTRQIKGTEIYDTYYVYNDAGKLCFVLPPLIQQAGIGAEALDLYAYQYKYDERNHCIWKKLPGCEPVYYVYDRAGQLILSQDGEQRKLNEWTFNKYDSRGRLVISGLYILNGKSHEYLQERCRDIVVKEEYEPEAHWSYTWNSLADLIETYGYKRILQVNFYDNYHFRKRPGYVDSKYNFVTNKGSEYNKRYGTDSSTDEHKGLLTGSATALLDESGKFSYAVYYYDHQKRLIQSRTSNHLDGMDEEYTAYNFTGQAVKKSYIHEDKGNKVEENYRYSYDHAGRLAETRHRLGNAAKTIVITNSYDELGRLSQTSRIVE